MKRRMSQALVCTFVGWFAFATLSFAETTAIKEALELDRQGFVGESIEPWKRFLDTSPKENLHVYGGIKLTIAYAKIGKALESLQTAQVLAQSYPENFDVQFNLGNAQSSIRKFKEAVAAFQKADTLRPQEGLTKVGLGLSLFGDGRTEDAVQVLREVRKLFKKQKNIPWYQNIRIMIGQMKSFAPYPPDFSNLWLTNNLKLVRDTYEESVLKQLEEQLDL